MAHYSIPTAALLAWSLKSSMRSRLKMTGSIPENINFAIKTGTLRDFLDKNAVTYRTSASASEMKISDIASRARAYMVRISCTANKTD